MYVLQKSLVYELALAISYRKSVNEYYKSQSAVGVCVCMYSRPVHSQGGPSYANDRLVWWIAELLFSIVFLRFCVFDRFQLLKCRVVQSDGVSIEKSCLKNLCRFCRLNSIFDIFIWKQSGGFCEIYSLFPLFFVALIQRFRNVGITTSFEYSVA